ncbi:MAG: M15 family metallopeptidase [Roseiflexus sp.]|uniref:M15 family metallopeptidase n=1 Tax=Roseiflexus sp. TaxID=2562120 RepID=UPI0025FA759E|nr:M15 family metallopeptidase [Roseiflexus sp.]MCL6542070.1 M15 family metallopeptidase [Roseiflexus sp.]
MNRKTFPKTPNGYEEMINQFGNIRNYMFEDGTLDSVRWETEYLDFCNLPFSMKLAWNNSYSVKRFRCHKLLVNLFEYIFSQIYLCSLEDSCKYFGGCYHFRAMKNSKKLSTHCWGIAIDLNPETNLLGSKGDMNPEIVKIFEDNGFVWGGRFTNMPDPMHFQFVKGY